jgi:two-component system, OmpR family, sensor kinase
MARHFLGLYLLLVATLVAASWGQTRLSQAYSHPRSTEEMALATTVALLKESLRDQPGADWKSTVARLAERSGVSMELYANAEVAGHAIVSKLDRGDVAEMRGASGELWLLKRLTPDYLLALRSTEQDAPRSTLDWLLTLAFYAAIALVLMAWLWPLTRDLRVLDTAVARFGDRNWIFSALISPRSQVFPLAETFRRMANRIDGLIASHKDLSNAVAHEIKTPLSRMQFEIELAQQATDLPVVHEHLGHITTDILGIDELVKSTLAYAVLERAEFSLNIGSHDFTVLVPAIVRAVAGDSRRELQFAVDVQHAASAVRCDLHLLDTSLRNLLHNAARYAARMIRVEFRVTESAFELSVDDDGPGIPPPDRQRVFESFVQLNNLPGQIKGFGLGLAIVKRAMEWHDGQVTVSSSALGGARFVASWPRAGVAPPVKSDFFLR